MADSTLHSLDELLTRTWSDDDWENEGLLQAQELVAGLEETEWPALNREWLERSNGWQKRLARALGSGPAHHALPILEQMLCGEDDELGIEAVTALWHRVSEEGKGAVPFSEKMVFRIEELAERASPLMQEFILELLERAGVHPD